MQDKTIIVIDDVTGEWVAQLRIIPEQDGEVSQNSAYIFRLNAALRLMDIRRWIGTSLLEFGSKPRTRSANQLLSIIDKALCSCTSTWTTIGPALAVDGELQDDLGEDYLWVHWMYHAAEVTDVEGSERSERARSERTGVAG